MAMVPEIVTVVLLVVIKGKKPKKRAPQTF